jgi:hypothetical protein
MAPKRRSLEEVFEAVETCEAPIRAEAARNAIIATLLTILRSWDGGAPQVK